MVTTSMPCDFSRTTSLPDALAGAGGGTAGAAPSCVDTGRGRGGQCRGQPPDRSQPWAMSPVPPSGGSAQSPIANTRGSPTPARLADDDAAVGVRPGVAARARVRPGCPGDTSRSARHDRPRAARLEAAVSTSTSSVRTPTRWPMPRPPLAGHDAPASPSSWRSMRVGAGCTTVTCTPRAASPQAASRPEHARAEDDRRSLFRVAATISRASSSVQGVHARGGARHPWSAGPEPVERRDAGPCPRSRAPGGRRGVPRGSSATTRLVVAVDGDGACHLRRIRGRLRSGVGRVSDARS